eukprot:3538331-Pleurochrysis_carterae.AAC.1
MASPSAPAATPGVGARPATRVEGDASLAAPPLDVEAAERMAHRDVALLRELLARRAREDPYLRAPFTA